MKYLKQIGYVLLLIGGLNWGIYGVSGYDLVDVIFGFIPMVARIIYVLVGLSSVYIILNRYSLCSGSCSCSTDTSCDKKSCNKCVTCKVEEAPEIKTE